MSAIQPKEDRNLQSIAMTDDTDGVNDDDKMSDVDGQRQSESCEQRKSGKPQQFEGTDTLTTSNTIADCDPQKSKLTKIRKNKSIKVSLIHSSSYTKVLYRAMEFIHQDRDILLAALLDYCGFLRKTPSFLSIVPPQMASRRHLESFHSSHYLDLLEFPIPGREHEPPPNLPLHLLDRFGLTDDCPLPEGRTERTALWNYLRHVAGASLQAAHLLTSNTSNVAIHWGGGRHHAHASHAGGFCYINDAVLALEHLVTQYSSVLYLDIDIHHADGVQRAFYDTDKVLVVSMHRRAPGFFPCGGSIGEKGIGEGVGYTVNLPMPQGCKDSDFVQMVQYTLVELVGTYNPEAVLLCVGADGLHGDPLVGPIDGWNLTPEGLAECVRLTAQSCNGRKLLVLGAGGYNAARTARTYVLSTAAACEGARPGMLWDELPKDIPRHDYFPRYGPDFSLVGDRPVLEENSRSGEYGQTLTEARETIDLAVVYIKSQKEKENPSSYPSSWSDMSSNGGVTTKGRRGRRRKRM